ncbi:MAG TPA: molybdopterin-binding protein [Candidatus Eremiobacteraceae bacterium]|nr:molybdopterin-binding protein [Candidatus Eremiobacteraceae bacterium]
MAAKRSAAAVTDGGAPHATPFAEAVRTWWTHLRDAGCPDRLAAEAIALHDAVGRAPAHVTRTKEPCPTYRAAAMDGFAVRAADLRDASAANPKRLTLGTDATPVDTGAKVPRDKDAVIPIEAVVVDGQTIVVAERIAIGKHVRLPGDDVPPGVAIGWPGVALRPVDCAALIASGCTTIDVVRKPRLTVIPSGDEVVAAGAPSKPGSVIDSNSPMIAAAARALGAEVTVTAVIADDDGALLDALTDAVANSDVVALLAGSSNGARDRGARTIERVGAIDVRGVATRPGRPVILGHSGGVAIVNLPGYPASCHFAFEAYVAPLLRRLGGFADTQARRARLARDVDTDGSRDEWPLATVLTAPGSPRAIVDPLPDIGGGLYRLARADARFRLRSGTAHHVRHVAVEWTPLRESDDTSMPLFAGPYDPLIEELAALAGFRCRWTADESGEALEEGTADAAGIIVRDGSFERVQARLGKGRTLLVIGSRREGIAKARSASHSSTGAAVELERRTSEDPWETAASIAAGMRTSARTTKFLAEQFALAFEEGKPALYAIVWEDGPGHRFPWAIAVPAALGAVASASGALGWEYIGMGSEVG